MGRAGLSTGMTWAARWAEVCGFSVTLRELRAGLAVGAGANNDRKGDVDARKVWR